MAYLDGNIVKKIFSNRIIQWAVILATLLLVISFASAQTARAASGGNGGLGPVPIVPPQTVILRSYNLPVPNAFQAPVAQPPLPELGGTCISGYLIDSYHKLLGAGWEVTLTPTQGQSQTTTSNPDGSFSFASLAAGTYMVELKVTEGWRPFTPTSFPVTLSGVGDGCANVRFKLEALPCIQVVKLDAAGEVNGQHIGIPGWNFTISSGDNSFKGVTDGQGLAYFYNLTPGTWTVTEEEKIGWRPASGHSTTLDLDLVSPETPDACQVALFVNEQVHDACITVQKTDVAGNPVPGWNVSVVRDDGTQPPVSAVTDENGEVTFDGLALGNWTVAEETREWWRPVGETTVGVSLERPGYCQVVKFVNEPLGCVDGYKINHLDQPLSGWKINARNSATGQTFSTVTDAGGYFYFNTLSLGDWVISEDMQEGWEPVTDPEFTVSVKTPFQCETVRFKNRTQFACVDVFKKDQIDGAGLPGWNITVQPAYGGSPVSGITDGTGWVRFNGLTPGAYVISEDVVSGWTATTPDAVAVELAATGSCSVINFTNIQTHLVPADPPSTDKDKAQPYECPMYYKVKPGDTLWALSNRFDVPVSAIARVNHLKNPRLIYVGTRLCIPLGDP